MGASYKDKVGLVPMSADILDWYINGGGGGGGRLKEGSPALTCAGWLTSHHLHHLNTKKNIIPHISPPPSFHRNTKTVIYIIFVSGNIFN